MTLTLELSAELATALRERAAQQGLGVAEYALSVIAAAVSQSVLSRTGADDSDFEAALDELAEIGDRIPTGDPDITYSRQDIYIDHD